LSAAVDAEALIPFLLLLVAVIGLWVNRSLWIAALILAVGSGYVTGALQAPALLWLAILALLALAFRTMRELGSGAGQVITGVAFFLFSIACSMLLLPGFERTVLIPQTVLSPGAAPFSLGVGFPKVVMGILILGLINETRVRGFVEAGVVARRTAPVLLLTVLAVLAAVYATGYVRFDPKWTAIFIPWAITNLFFTCLAEEAGFRGFLQHELGRIGSNPKIAAVVALIISAVLFGLAHLGGGWSYALAATVAGLGYGAAYLRTRRIEAAMAVHFSVNALHFMFFTYPRLA
jgi:uncharacterized protein